MNTKYSVLRAAVVIALGTTLYSHANAGVIRVGEPAKLSTELVNETASTVDKLKFDDTNYLEIDISAISGRSISETSPVEMRITLTDGATFATPPTAANFICGGVASVNVLGGAADQRTATFKLANGTVPAAATCLLKGGVINLGNHQNDHNIIVSGYLKDTVEPVTISTAGPIVTFRQACSMNVETQAVTIDVGYPSLSKKFFSNVDVAK